MPDTKRAASGAVLWRTSCGDFGFIVPDAEGEPDLFVHRSDMASDPSAAPLAGGDAVDYEVHVGPLGPWARNVRRRG
ncbi:cold-shock protein [Streptomyces sp. NPDC006487]|uniref:cold-shock protein n=1 Tax=Streptomyces sp. NPDC006487 TaxID=3364748 RepID=UPI0036CBE5B3